MSANILWLALRYVRIGAVITGAIFHALACVAAENPVDANASSQASKTNGANLALTAKMVRGATAMVPLTAEAPAKLFLDPPVPEVLARGMMLIQFRTENLRVMPLIGPAAANVSPRIGHLHVRVDDSPWIWAHTSGDDLIVNRLTAGPHKIEVEMVNANHELLATEVVKFEVPQGAHTAAFPTEHDVNPELNAKDKYPSKLFVESPQPDKLARGVALIQCRTENAQITQVFGAAALGVTPRICHLHVTVDDARWRWAHTSDGPVVIGGLPPGPHKVLVELVNSEHKPIAHSIVTFVVPQSASEHHEPKAAGDKTAVK